MKMKNEPKAISTVSKAISTFTEELLHELRRRGALVEKDEEGQTRVNGIVLDKFLSVTPIRFAGSLTWKGTLQVNLRMKNTSVPNRTWRSKKDGSFRLDDIVTQVLSEAIRRSEIREQERTRSDLQATLVATPEWSAFRAEALRHGVSPEITKAQVRLTVSGLTFAEAKIVFETVRNLKASRS